MPRGRVPEMSEHTLLQEILVERAITALRTHNTCLKGAAACFSSDSTGVYWCR